MESARIEVIMMNMPEIFTGGEDKDGVLVDYISDKKNESDDDKEPQSHAAAAKAAPPLPEHDPDPFGMAFTQEEIDKLTDVNNEAAVKAAFADATPEMRALLSAKQIDRK